MYHVLALGYKPEEYKTTFEKWIEYDFRIEYVYSADQAQQFLSDKIYSLVLFHSRMLDCLPYINIMRSIKSVPVLVLTPEYTNAEQTQLAIQYLLNTEIRKVE